MNKRIEKDPARVRIELVPTGVLRVGVVSAPAASPLFVTMGPSGPRGVTVDLGRELARLLSVAVNFSVVSNSGELTDLLEGDQIDVSFMPVDEERRRRVDFGPAYFFAESTCFVVDKSPFKSNADLNKPGVRVVGISNTTTIRSVGRVLNLATVMSASSVGEALDMLQSAGADALALSRDSLRPYLLRYPGSRILDGSLQSTGIAVAVKKGHAAALAYVSGFIEHTKRTGFVKRAFDRMGLYDDDVAAIA